MKPLLFDKVNRPEDENHIEFHFCDILKMFSRIYFSFMLVSLFPLISRFNYINYVIIDNRV